MHGYVLLYTTFAVCSSRHHIPAGVYGYQSYFPTFSVHVQSILRSCCAGSLLLPYNPSGPSLAIRHCRTYASGHLPGYAKTGCFRDRPGGPARPRNCLSTRRLSCRSVPMIAKPPRLFTFRDRAWYRYHGPPYWWQWWAIRPNPSATTCASLACCFALVHYAEYFLLQHLRGSTIHLLPPKWYPKGLACGTQLFYFFNYGLYFPAWFYKMRSCSSLRIPFTLVGNGYRIQFKCSRMQLPFRPYRHTTSLWYIRK